MIGEYNTKRFWTNQCLKYKPNFILNLKPYQILYKERPIALYLILRRYDFFIDTTFKVLVISVSFHFHVP